MPEDRIKLLEETCDDLFEIAQREIRAKKIWRGRCIGVAIVLVVSYVAPVAINEIRKKTLKKN